MPCVTAFVQGPDQPIKGMNLTIPSAIDPSRPAVIDEAHRLFVNYEVYYFADDALKARFQADPVSYTGMLTDPVTLERFQPDTRSPRREFGGRIYYFPGAGSASTFDADPDRFAIPHYKMTAM